MEDAMESVSTAADATASRVTNVLFAGVGGQGVMTASEVLAQTAIAQGLDAKKTEVAGMAQRGGVVTSAVRFGRRVISPVIPPGMVDIVVAFELAEAGRWAEQLRPGGVVMVNTLRLAPLVVSGGLFPYPQDPIGELQAQGATVHAFDAAAIARELGDMRLVNTIMLGAIADFLPFPAAHLEEQIVARFRSRKPEMAAINQQAFQAGRAIHTPAASAA